MTIQCYNNLDCDNLPYENLSKSLRTATHVNATLATWLVAVAAPPDMLLYRLLYGKLLYKLLSLALWSIGCYIAHLSTGPNRRLALYSTGTLQAVTDMLIYTQLPTSSYAFLQLLPGKLLTRSFPAKVFQAATRHAALQAATLHSN